MTRELATEDIVEGDELVDFVRPRHRWVLVTLRADGRPRTVPVAGAVAPEGTLLIATYPERDHVADLEHDPRVSVCVLSDHDGGAWVQVDGRAAVSHGADAMGGLADHYRAVSGEHHDWDEFRATMARQGRCLITIGIDGWGPVVTGAVPASLASIDNLSGLLARDEDDDEGIDDELYYRSDDDE